MTWKDAVEELNKRKELSYRMGGEENVKKQRDLGKMTARERIELFWIQTHSWKEGYYPEKQPTKK